MRHDQKMAGRWRMGNPDGNKKRLLFVITEDWFFVSHFLGLARLFRDSGYEIGIVTRLNSQRSLLAGEGFALFDLQGARGALSIVAALREVMAIARAIKRFRPDLLHLIALRPILLGGIASLVYRKPARVLAPTGLGYLWTSERASARLLRRVITALIGVLARRSRTHFLFENGEDPAIFGLERERAHVTVIGGAGVDPALFQPMSEPEGLPIRFAIVARMLRTKGVAEAVAAFQAVRRQGLDIALDLYGDCDPHNPDTLTPAALENWSHGDGITWHGRSNDVAGTWRESHVALLMSHREGLPRSLVEAAACARPIIASDVTGCREIVRDGETGFLVPLGDQARLVAAITTLARDGGLRQRMGAAGRAFFETRFTLDAISAAVLDVYRQLLAR